jgi:hypothetical protein
VSREKRAQNGKCGVGHGIRISAGTEKEPTFQNRLLCIFLCSSRSKQNFSEQLGGGVLAQRLFESVGGGAAIT